MFPRGTFVLPFNTQASSFCGSPWLQVQPVLLDRKILNFNCRIVLSVVNYSSKEQILVALTVALGKHVCAITFAASSAFWPSTMHSTSNVRLLRIGLLEWALVPARVPSFSRFRSRTLAFIMVSPIGSPARQINVHTCFIAWMWCQVPL